MRTLRADHPVVVPVPSSLPGWHLSAVRRALLLSSLSLGLTAQEMQPRAYIPAPVGLNFLSIGYSHNRGGVLLDPSLPVEDMHVRAGAGQLAFAQSLGVLGRTTQVLVVLPYLVANLDGRYAGTDQHLYRSGLGDAVFRYAMNIRGAAAMGLKELSHYGQKTIVGASITVSVPTGQYDPNLLINIGTNRWAFKPEVGLSRAFGKWTIEGAAGAWLYTPNNRYHGNSVRTQVPLGSLQVHVVRFLPRRAWVAGDYTFYTGGRTEIDGRENADYQANTRWGATFGIPIGSRQAIKISYFTGMLTRFGTDIRSIGVSYNLIWMKGRL